MNKTEKLLAARKKLKEFQLHKSNHDQEVTKNQSNDDQHKKDNSVMSDHNKCNNNDEESNINENNEQLQPHLDSTISNITNTTELTESNSKFTKSEAYSNEEDTRIMSRSNEIYRHIEESPELSSTRCSEANHTGERTLSLTSLHHKKEWLTNETTTKIFETMKLSDNILNNSTSFKVQNNENDADFFNNTIAEQTSAHMITTANTNLININGESNNFTSSTHLDVKIEDKSSLLCLDAEQNMVQQHQNQVSQLQNKINELENLLILKNTNRDDKYFDDVNSLKEQIQMYRQAAEIFVAEKADLNSALSQYQTTAQQKASEVSELYEKLKHMIARTTDMERHLIAAKTNAKDCEILNEKLMNDYMKLEQQHIELKKIREEQQLETAEMQQDLNIKKTELINIQQKLEENKNLLSLAELKILQLTSAPQQLEKIENQNKANASLNQELSQLQENLKSLNTEKEDMCKHYESYVKQLDTKYEGTVQELELTQKKIHEVGEREESLIQRLALMEQQYQREKQKVDSLLPLQAHEEKIIHLTKSMDSLVLENENLQHVLHEKESEVELIKEELRELRELRDQGVETKKLVTALESGQLGASRAVSQNQQLKLQLNEMHDAFVMLSNSKLNLTEQLQNERSVGRRLNAEYSRIEAMMEELQEELNRKSAIIEELERDKLHLAQIADQMQHYQVQSTQTRTLQQELQNALSTIEILKNENQSLNEKLNGSTQIVDEIHIDNKTMEIQNNDKIEIEDSDLENVSQREKMCEVLKQSQNTSYDTLAENQKKLELRFKETMERVAELTDEKQRLEHLVLQLQGETETIGEYITLYQKQRAILQMKAQEKEHTFNQLIEERNRQQAQLHQLKILITDLLKIDQHTTNTTDIVFVSHQNVLSHNFQRDKHQIDESKIENNETTKQNFSKADHIDIKNETTSKILELLTEIKDCKDTCSVEPNFHHCLWCSGKLITI